MPDAKDKHVTFDIKKNQEKVKELELLFKKEPLDKLKELTLMNDGQEITTGEGMVGQGNGEGQEGDRESQTKSD